MSAQSSSSATADKNPNASAAAAEASKGNVSDDDIDDSLPYAETIRQLKRDRAAIRDGSDPEFQSRLNEYDRVRRKRLKNSQIHRDYQLSYIEALYKFNEQEANNVYEEAKRSLQNTMLAQVNDQLSRYIKVKDANEAEMRMSTRKLRSKAKEGADGSGGRARKRSKYGNGEDAPIDFAMAPEEISKDLKIIHRDWVKNAKHYHDALPDYPMVSLRVENGVLIIKDELFHIGDRITLASEYSGETFSGTITSLNAVELYVRLLDNSKARVLLKHIRNSRVKIAKEMVR